MEIGCGTGLLTVLVAPEVNTITAVDSSSGMIKALKAKLANNPALSNVTAVEALLEDADDLRIRQNPERPRQFQLIISHLVLHHIPDLPKFLTLLYDCLGDRGQVALTDFENEGPQSRAFHPESKMEGVERHGIRKDEIKSLMEQAGFERVSVTRIFSIEKGVETGGTQKFPFLMIQGHRFDDAGDSE